mmetsp:Transcript_23722/g.66620  ORF Transcript_23722/g.66620 Transcript_23722/m.66620 type:complete len:416 (+) Transcript_23722:664-1911(+)
MRHGILAKSPLVLGQHHFAGNVGPRDHEDAVSCILRVLGLLWCCEAEESPVAARITWLVVEVDVNDLAVLRELGREHVLGDVIRQRAHKNLLGALGRRWLVRGGGNVGRVGRLRLYRVRRGLVRPGLFPEHPLVARERDLAGLLAPGEHQRPVRGHLGVLGLLGHGERDERPLPARLDRLAVEVHVDDGPVLAKLRAELGLRDAVGQRADEDLLRRGGALAVRRRLRLGRPALDGVGGRRVRVAAAPVGGLPPVAAASPVAAGPGGVLAEHALVLRDHDVAGALGPGELEDAVGGILGALGLVGRGEGDEGPLPRAFAAVLHEDILHRPELAELRTDGAVRDAVWQRAHEELPARCARHDGVAGVVQEEGTRWGAASLGSARWLAGTTPSGSPSPPEGVRPRHHLDGTAPHIAAP